MKSENNKIKNAGLAFFGLFILVGCYNAFVINSDSHLSDHDQKFMKRLDEINGVTIPGRAMAGSLSWQKLDPKRIVKRDQQMQKLAEIKNDDAPVETEEPLVKEELNLSLVEVINPKKYQAGLVADQFNGTLSSSNGVIENLVVSLPQGEGMSVSFSELAGNVFEYDLNGEIYSGMMYQVDQKSYMVTLTNGPLEGTRLRFSSDLPAVQQFETQEALAAHNVEVGTFGANPVQEISTEVAHDENIQHDNFQAQGFNMDQQATM